MIEHQTLCKFHVFIQNEKILILSPSPLEWIVTNREGYELFEEMMGYLTYFKNIMPYLNKSTNNLYNFIQKNLHANKDEYNGNAFLLSSPETVYIHLTNKCTLYCTYCYAHKYKDSLPEMNYEMGIKILNRCKEQLPSSYIVFTGGEPIINPNFNELIEYSLNLGFRVGLITNGTLLDHIPLKLLNKIDFQISLDGVNAEINNLTRGKFETVMSGIDRLLKNGIRPEIRATLTLANKDHAVDFFKFWRERGITPRFFVVQRFGVESVNTKLRLTDKDLFDLLDEFRLVVGSYKEALEIILFAGHMSLFKPINCCGIGNTSITIDGTGNVYPCIHLCLPELTIGNIFQRSIVEILHSGALNEMRSKVEDIPDCINCEFRYICGGGCKAKTYFQTGTFSSKYVDCDLIKQLILKCMFEERLA